MKATVSVETDSGFTWSLQVEAEDILHALEQTLDFLVADNLLPRGGGHP